MNNTELHLQPFAEPDWEVEDLLAGQLADEIVLATETEARQMLEELRFSLPPQIEPKLLVDDVPTENAGFDFYSIEVPLNILVPEDSRLVRLRLRLDLNAGTSDGTGPVVAYDLFPGDKFEVKDIDIGKVSVDISKLLTYICPAVGECLGLNLNFPIQWKSRFLSIQTTDRMSNPVEWYVKDQSILNSFRALAIIRAPKGTNVTVTACLAGELRKSGLLGKITKARFISDSRMYTLKKEQSNETLPASNI